jgi:hypothetical protein
MLSVISSIKKHSLKERSGTPKNLAKNSRTSDNARKFPESSKIGKVILRNPRVSHREAERGFLNSFIHLNDTNFQSARRSHDHSSKG